MMRRYLAVGVAVGALSGCGQDAGKPASAEDVRTRLTPLVARLSDGLGKTFAAVTHSEAWRSLDESFKGLRALGDGTDTLAPTPMGLLRAELRQGYVEYAIRTSLGDDRTPGESLGDALGEAAEQEGEGVWRVRGEAVCPRSYDLPDVTVPGGPSSNPPVPMPGADDARARCIRIVDDLEIRLRITLPGGDGLDVALLVGPARDEVLDLQLRMDSAQLELDLGAIRGAAAHVASVVGARVSLPQVLEGRLRFSVRVQGTEDAVVEAGITRAVRAEGNDVHVAIAARDPYFQLAAHGGDDPTLDVTYDWGHTEVEAPIALGGPSARLAVDLAGLGGSLHLEGGDPTVRFTGIGFGDATSRATLDGQPLVELDLNAMMGRHTDLTVTSGARPVVELRPGLDLRAAMRLGALERLGRSVPSHLRDEVYTVAVTDAPRLSPVQLADGTRALEVLAGQIAIASSAVADRIVVPAGRCLARDAYADGEHPVLGRLAARDCR